MEVLKNILFNYWPQILAVILFVVSFILQIVKKKPVSDIESFIYNAAIKATKLAEAGDKKGDDKLNAAVSYVLLCLNNTFPKLDSGRYIRYIEKIIEEILTTPQKKGGN